MCYPSPEGRRYRFALCAAERLEALGKAGQFWAEGLQNVPGGSAGRAGGEGLATQRSA